MVNISLTPQQLLWFLETFTAEPDDIRSDLDPNCELEDLLLNLVPADSGELL